MPFSSHRHTRSLSDHKHAAAHASQQIPSYKSAEHERSKRSESLRQRIGWASPSPSRVTSQKKGIDNSVGNRRDASPSDGASKHFDVRTTNPSRRPHMPMQKSRSDASLPTTRNLSSKSPYIPSAYFGDFSSADSKSPKPKIQLEIPERPAYLITASKVPENPDNGRIGRMDSNSHTPFLSKDLDPPTNLTPVEEMQSPESVHQASPFYELRDPPPRPESISSLYSRRTSAATIAKTKGQPRPGQRRHSLAFSVMDPTAAGVFDVDTPPVPRLPANLVIPQMDRVRAVNVNKPLPPAPTFHGIEALRLPPRSSSRDAARRFRNASAPENLSTSTTNSVLPQHLPNLSSRYSPLDLDRLDAAFQDSNPQQKISSYQREHSSCSQAKQALDQNLIVQDTYDFQGCRGSIRKNPPIDNMPDDQADFKINYVAAGHDYFSSQIPNNSKASSFFSRRGDHSMRNEQSAHQYLASGKAIHNYNSSADSSSNILSSSSMSSRSRTPETDILSLVTDENDNAKTRACEKGIHTSANQGADLGPRTPASAIDRIFSAYLGSPESPILSSAFETFMHGEDTESSKNAQVVESGSRQTQLLDPGDAQPNRCVYSIALSEIHDMYACMPSSDPDQSITRKRSINIDSRSAENVLLGVLRHADNMHDLFAIALTNRGFYRTFKRHELVLLQSALHAMSPAAFELREATNTLSIKDKHVEFQDAGNLSASIYLNHYIRDVYVITALKAVILTHCKACLRPATVVALSENDSQRVSAIDDACWRIWTFCVRFGAVSGRQTDVEAQLDWLCGLAGHSKQGQSRMTDDSSFGIGNSKGLTADELFDMLEIWLCMSVLVSGLQTFRQEARSVGVFDAVKRVTIDDIAAEQAVLEEWTYHILTLGPAAVLDVTPSTLPTAATFVNARSKGYTNWSVPDQSSANFFKAAVTRAYNLKITSPAPSISEASMNRGILTDISQRISAMNLADTQDSEEQHTAVAQKFAARSSQEKQYAKPNIGVESARSEHGFSDILSGQEWPMSVHPDVAVKHDSSLTLPPIDPLPIYTSNAIFDQEHKLQTTDSMDKAVNLPTVEDPTDVALNQLVEMGFSRTDAKWALARTDTGKAVNVEDALSLLMTDYI